MPQCPKCGSLMIKRLAKRGRNTGKYFYGCSKYPECKSVININGNMTKKSLNQDLLYESITFKSYTEPRQFKFLFWTYEKIPQQILMKVEFEHIYQELFTVKYINLMTGGESEKMFINEKIMKEIVREIQTEDKIISYEELEHMHEEKIKRND